MRASVFFLAFAAALRPTWRERIVYAAATALGNVSLSLSIYRRRRGMVKKIPT